MPTRNYNYTRRPLGKEGALGEDLNGLYYNRLPNGVIYNDLGVKEAYDSGGKAFFAQDSKGFFLEVYTKDECRIINEYISRVNEWKQTWIDTHYFNMTWEAFNEQYPKPELNLG